MITVSIEENAGLGNQLFQYAHGYAMAKRAGQKLNVVSYIGRSDNVRAYMLDQMQLDMDVVCKVTRVDVMNIFKGKVFKGSNALNRIYRRLLQKKYAKKIDSGKLELRKMEKGQNRMYIPDAPLEAGKDYYVDGFYESYKFFYDVAQDVRKQLKLKPDCVDEESKNWENEIKSCNSVALHIRMGDFATCNRLFPIEFYDAAYEKLCKELDNPVFFIFSEDEGVKEFFRQKGKHNIRIVTLQSKNKDMMEWHLLSMCHHHVVTNSTYSWWSAFAADYPDKRVFIPDMKQYLERENADIYRGKDPYGEEHYLNYFLPEYEVI